MISFRGSEREMGNSSRRGKGRSYCFLNHCLLSSNQFLQIFGVLAYFAKTQGGGSPNAEDEKRENLDHFGWMEEVLTLGLVERRSPERKVIWADEGKRSGSGHDTRWKI
jgi:hypothetical protein